MNPQNINPHRITRPPSCLQTEPRRPATDLLNPPVLNKMPYTLPGQLTSCPSRQSRATKHEPGCNSDKGKAQSRMTAQLVLRRRARASGGVLGDARSVGVGFRRRHGRRVCICVELIHFLPEDNVAASVRRCTTCFEPVVDAARATWPRLAAAQRCGSALSFADLRGHRGSE